MREVQDHYFKQAKRDGYRSRAAYKLVEILDKKKVIARGDRVLDVGAAPGSWSQVLARRLGPGGVIVAIDLKVIDQSGLPENVLLIVGDLTEASLEELGGLPFQAIVSDMAPDTTGDRFGDHHRSVRLCHTLLDRANVWLAPGGNLVMKVFEGEAYRDLLDRMKEMFESVKGFKPKASRSESVEMFLIARGFTPGEVTVDPADRIPTRKPSTGWGG